MSVDASSESQSNPLGEENRDRQFANTLARGLEVLRAFTATESVLTNRAISDRTGLHKATVSRLCYTLSLYGYLRQTESGAYTLGTAVLSLVHPLLASLRLRQTARPMLQSLAEQTGCTVNLALRERVSAIYVDSVRPDLANPHLPEVGSVSPLLQSAIGRAIILAVHGEDRTQLLNRIQVNDPAEYEQGIEYLNADRQLLSAKGYCRARGPWKADIDAIAVPIPLPRHVDVAAINCTIAIKSRLSVDLDSVAPLLLATAHNIAVAFCSQRTFEGPL